MSFINALASSGLTVGLRFYTAEHIRKQSEAASLPADPAPPAEAACPAGEGCRASRPAAPPPLSPEERALGRAEAQAQLAAEGALGLLMPGLSSPVAAPEAAAEEEEASGSQLAGASGEAEGPLKKLTPEEEAQVRKMAERDREVKAHEQAHVGASGGLAGSPQYSYQTGPDGQQYAVGGQVSISRGGSSNTDQAISEAEAVKRGATAPAQPSSQDLAVAARAEADIQQLKAKKTQEKQEETGGQENGPAASPASYGSESAVFKTAPEKTNGADFGLQVAGAYAAVKLGFQNSVRPLLARA
jgi:hypothetical protein